MPEVSSSSSSSSGVSSSLANDTMSKNVVINMRVTANSNQGHRKYMEDCYKIRFQRESSLNANNKTLLHNEQLAQPQSQQSDILFSYFGIFDGHGGKEASQFCKEKLYWKIIELDDFWSDNDTQVLNAIRNGFVKCHMDMWKELPNWPKTASGLPSTSGSTATVLFIKKNKAYVGHVGDSGLVIGFSKYPGDVSNNQWQGKKLTRDHKPEDPIELKRIQNSGGSVMSKSGVNRVVWNRPILFPTASSASNLPQTHSSSSRKSLHHQASTPYEMNYLRNQRNVPTERVPFLAVARSLGDLWSYDTQHDEFIVSPVPDTFVFEIDPQVHKCLILATDGLWNVIRANECVDLVRQTDKETEKMLKNANKNSTMTSNVVQPFINPSQRLVNTALQRCCEKMIRADNTSCITIMIDQPPASDDTMDLELEKSKSKRRNKKNRNKTFDDFSSRLTDGEDEDDFNDYDDEEDDIDDDFNSDLEENESLYRTNLTVKSEFNTPLNNDKRSRSLTSVRRRHWSASSNRSSSVSQSIHANNQHQSKQQQQQHKNMKFVNSDNRNQPRLYNPSHNNDKSVNMNKNDFANKSTSTNGTHSNYQPRESVRRKMLQSNNMNNLDSDKNEVDHELDQTKKSSKCDKSMLNGSLSVAAFNKLSKNLRKSLNDLYSTNGAITKMPASKINQKQEESKENNVQNLNKSKTSPSRQSRYAKRLKRLKNRLIQTKNSLFGRKATRQTANAQANLNTSLSKRKSISSPFLSSNAKKADLKFKLNISSIDLNATGGAEDKCESNGNNNDKTFGEQSFVNAVKSKISYLKRNRSSKIIDQQHADQQGFLNSTNLVSSNKMNVSHNKRPKFY